ncbi:MAG TPA: cation:proton antiporter, partial [Nodosilinea sp.]|nr:cation:proton antiporter [Nodosilinea sp.]
IENTEQVVLAITGQQANLGQIKSTLAIAQCLAEELKAPLHVVQMTIGSKRDRKLTALLQEQDIAVKPVQGNTVKRVSAAVQPNTLLILIASTYTVGQPALGRDPEAITRANWDTNIIIANFPTKPKNQT